MRLVEASLSLLPLPQEKADLPDAGTFFLTTSSLITCGRPFKSPTETPETSKNDHVSDTIFGNKYPRLYAW